MPPRPSYRASFYIPVYYSYRTTRSAGHLCLGISPWQRTTQTQNKHTQTFMLRVGFAIETPALGRAMAVLVLDR
jgi:hypothetical protein